MPTFALQQSFSSARFLSRVLDFLAVCIGGWVAYQLRFWVTGDWATLRPQENLLILSLALFSALFFGKTDRILPGGQALASMAGRVAAGWLMVWTLLVVLLALTKNAE